jgi:hypothetical protein
MSKHAPGESYYAEPTKLICDGKSTNEPEDAVSSSSRTENAVTASPRGMELDMESLSTSLPAGAADRTRSTTASGVVGCQTHATENETIQACNGPRKQLHFRRAQPSETRQLKEWIAANHYLQSAPPGFVQLYEFTVGCALVGGMILGRPSAKSYDPDYILQLHRVFFIDQTEHCIESQALAMMRKHVRVWLPQVRGLLSYSDPTIGHEGVIYIADGWCPLGLTDEAWGYGWNSRKDRREQKVSRKLRWFRTP